MQLSSSARVCSTWDIMKNFDVDEAFRKFPEMERDEVEKLCEWVQKQPHLPDLTVGEVILFFQACYYSMELAKQTIDINFTTRTHCPEFFQNLDPNQAELRKAMKTLTVLPLPKCTPEGYRVIISKITDLDPSNFNFPIVMKLYCMCFDLWLLEEGAEKGHVMVIDMKGFSLGHLARLGLLTVKKFLFYLQEGSAIRLKGFHFINIVPFMDKILNLMSPFMKKELIDVLQMHPNMESFYKYIPKNILPSDYEGNDIDSETMTKSVYENVINNRDQFLYFEANRRVNEKLRPGKPKNASDLFGVEGNFKKLEID